jgi:hypothetical protein
MEQNENIKVIDEKQAAAIMRRSIQTLRNDRHLRRGCPYLKIGRSVRYTISDIHNFLAASRIDPESR